MEYEGERPQLAPTQHAFGKHVGEVWRVLVDRAAGDAPVAARRHALHVAVDGHHPAEGVVGKPLGGVAQQRLAFQRIEKLHVGVRHRLAATAPTPAHFPAHQDARPDPQALQERGAVVEPEEEQVMAAVAR